jgi:hypothetical protein
MNESKHPVFSDAELEASLQGLGVTELEQRLEFSALLAGAVDAGADETAASVCCSCKIPPDDIFGDGPVPTIEPDPTPGDTISGTGPTDGLGW